MNKIFVVKNKDRGNLAYMCEVSKGQGYLNKTKTGFNWAGTPSLFRDPSLYEIENIPLEGFKLVTSVSRSSTSNKVVRLEDPRDFTLEITVENMMNLISQTTVVNGVIQGKCYWEGKTLVLQGSKQDVKANPPKKTIPFGKLVIGDTYLNKYGNECVYLGKKVMTVTKKDGGLVEDKERHWFKIVKGNKARYVSYASPFVVEHKGKLRHPLPPVELSVTHSVQVTNYSLVFKLDTAYKEFKKYSFKEEEKCLNF